ncbi:MAG: DUF2089 domain-containing protein [Bacteriovoracaceae bacterium]|nr:DUF2089 domain-containing protein [Bacteriovoracaceae bacterium]
MKQLTKCPYCEGNFEVQKVKCLSCETEISGSFNTNRFHVFSSEQLYFIEVFLNMEGNIKLVEKELGISYPTVKNRLHKIIEMLGYKKEKSPVKNKKTELLKKLSDGELSFDKVMKELKDV